MSSVNETVGLYQYCAVAGNEGTPGAPVLHLSLLVNAVTGKVTGHGTQTQAVSPPGDKIDINISEGKIRATGLGEINKVMALKGSAVVSLPPPAIGSYLAPFEAHFGLYENMDGAGGWTLGTTDVDNVPIKKESC